MKNLLLAVIAILTLASCQQQKIGYVDNGTVINDIQEKKDIEEKYKGKKAVFDKKTDSIGKAFQLEAQKFQLESKKMSSKKAQAKYDELGQKQQLLQQQIQFEQQQIGQAYQTELDSLIVKVKDHVKDYGKKNGYNFILGTSDGASSVIFGQEGSDLSEIIIKELDAAYKK